MDVSMTNIGTMSETELRELIRNAEEASTGSSPNGRGLR